jgi:GH24 family phage-related lysozyme (muramidase)
VPSLKALLGALPSPQEDSGADDDLIAPAQVEAICEAYASWKAMQEEAAQVRRRTNEALAQLLDRIEQENELGAKLEKGLPLYERLVRLGAAFAHHKLPLEQKCALAPPPDLVCFSLTHGTGRCGTSTLPRAR